MLPLVALLLFQAAEAPKQVDVPRCTSPMAAEKRVQPDYPKAAYRAGTEGTVELEGLVDVDGNVRDVQVLSGDAELARAAADAFKRWKYAPCRVDGKPIEASIAVSFAFQFKLREHYTKTCPSSRWSTVTPKPPEQGTQRVKVNAGVTAGALEYAPKPEYPAAARLQHLGGVVLMCAIIGKDGTLKELGVLQGHPILAEAAFTAVKRWRYRPYKLDGEPVEVDTTITVNFQPQ